MPVLRAASGCLAAAFLLVSLPAAAGKMYQWKDANGVTHYTDTPPPVQHKTRTINARPAPAPASAKPIVNANCSNARSNLTLLQGETPVGIDENKDGKPDRPLTDAERARRRKLAEAEVDAYCEVALDKRG